MAVNMLNLGKVEENKRFIFFKVIGKSAVLVLEKIFAVRYVIVAINQKKYPALFLTGP